MSWIQNLNLQGRFLEISRRFPVVLAFAFLTTLTLIMTIEDDTGKLFRWPVAGFTGFLSVLVWTIYCEVNTCSKKIFWSGIILILVLLSFYFYLIPLEISQKSSCFWYFSIGLSIILHLLITLVPFIRKYDKISFVNYNISIFIAWMQSALYALLMFIALSLAILAMDNLFDIQIKSILYFKLFILITGLFQSSLFLSDLPDDYSDKSIPAAKSVFRVIVFYLFIPVTILYGLIIYAYFLRVTLTPHEMVEWTFVMILWYFATGILAWLFAAYYEYSGANILINHFRKWFFPLSVLPCVFLFVSLYKNTSVTGINEELYLSASVAALIGIILLYYLIGFGKDQRFIPLLSIIFCVLCFWSGPISVCRVPVKNQQKRLILEMEKAGLIQNNVLSIDTSKSYIDSSNQLSQKLYFLSSRDALGFLKDYDKKGFIKKDKDSIQLNDILTVLHLNQLNVADANYFEYSHEIVNSFEIDSYAKLIPINNYNDQRFKGDYLKIEKNLILLFLNGQKIGESEISKDVLYLAESKSENNVIEKNINSYNLRIIVTSASGQRNGDSLESLYLSGYVLLKSMK